MDWPFCYFKVRARVLPTIVPVGARGVVHTLQFNGKQEGEFDRTDPTCAAPATVKRTCLFQGAAPSTQATGCLEQASGKADAVVFASPDTGQQGGLALAQGCDAQALSGKAVRVVCFYLL